MSAMYNYYTNSTPLNTTGILLVAVYDLYFKKQFILLSESFIILYALSWLYTCFTPFLFVNSIVTFLPISDFLITNLFEIKLLILYLFIISYTYIYIIYM